MILNVLDTALFSFTVHTKTDNADLIWSQCHENPGCTYIGTARGMKSLTKNLELGTSTHSTSIKELKKEGQHLSRISGIDGTVVCVFMARLLTVPYIEAMSLQTALSLL